MTEIKTITHNDEPTIQCSLNRKELKNLIIEQIAESTPPKAIAVHGTWGSGKTSFLMQIYSELGGNHFKDKTKNDNINPSSKSKGVKTVWFEAWQYQNEPNILAALLKEIRDQLAWYHKLWKDIEETAVPGLMSLLQSIDVSFEKFGIKFAVSGSNFVENETKYLTERYSHPLETLTLRKLLEDAIDKLLELQFKVLELNGKKNRSKIRPKKAIIFIDDLDRCEPETAFKILEAIKVYLNLRNCVFVLGMDVKAVERIIASYYEKKKLGYNSVKVRDLARLYLEKICQDVYHLPMPERFARQNLLQKLLTGKIEKDLRQSILKIATEYKFLPPFPRSIKIFANVLISFCSKAKVADFAREGDKGVEKMIILAYLYAFHYELYHLCYFYMEKHFYTGTFLKFCENSKSFEESRGKHSVLSDIILPEKVNAGEAMGATAFDPNSDKLERTFPIESLRQVLWIRPLILDTGDIWTADLEQLKI